MPQETTLSIIKPDAVKKNIIGNILLRLEEADLTIIAAKMVRMSPEQARAFYAVHQERSFFDDLVHFMTSAPILALVLQGDGAVMKNRQLMGDTDPQKAQPGTIRSQFADSVEANAVHGSDSLKNAEIEIAFFFSRMEIHPRTKVLSS